MFSIYRRHEKTCRYRKKGVRHLGCACPLWMDGTDARGRRIRRSLKTRDWDQAQARLAAFEKRGNQPAPPRSVRLDAAAAEFFADCRTRNLQPATIRRYETSLAHVVAAFGGRALDELTLEKLTHYRNGRPIAASTSQSELRHLRQLLNFCVERHWIPSNPALRLRMPRTTAQPTLPFTDQEVARILAACDTFGPNDTQMQFARCRARALVLLLLYSGFRISDAVQLRRSAVDLETGRILVRTMKTGAAVYIRIPEPATRALAALDTAGDYFFWTGTSHLATGINSAAVTIKAVLAHAQVAQGHAHRFRDTFSVALLNKGVELRTVQLLLGHSSIHTTEAHYAPYVASTQHRLDDALANLDFTGAGAPAGAVAATPAKLPLAVGTARLEVVGGLRK